MPQPPAEAVYTPGYTPSHNLMAPRGKSRKFSSLGVTGFEPAAPTSRSLQFSTVFPEPVVIGLDCGAGLLPHSVRLSCASWCQFATDVPWQVIEIESNFCSIALIRPGSRIRVPPFPPIESGPVPSISEPFRFGGHIGSFAPKGYSALVIWPVSRSKKPRSRTSRLTSHFLLLTSLTPIFDRRTRCGHRPGNAAGNVIPRML